jgi:hypothetical protein
MKSVLSMATAVAVLSLISGCGTGSGGGSSAPTREEFIRRADAICKQVGGRQRAARRTFWVNHPGVLGTRQWREEREGWEKDVVEAAMLPPVQIEAEELSKLPVPTGDERQVRLIIDEIKKAVRKGAAHPGALIEEGAVGPFAHVERLARGYGFGACANPLDS